MFVHSNLLKDEQQSSSIGSKKAKGKTITSNARSMHNEKTNLAPPHLQTQKLRQWKWPPTRMKQDNQASGQEGIASKTIQKFSQRNLQMHLKNHSLSRKNFTSRRIWERIVMQRGWVVPFQFDVLAQLANIPARINLQELLQLLKTTRDALESLSGFGGFSCTESRTIYQ